MTDRDLRHLLSVWQERLGLDLWRIELRVGCELETSFMEIHRQSSYERAIVYYQPWLLDGELPDSVIDFDLTDGVVEEKLVHELLHCHTIGMVAVVRDDIDGQMHRDVETVMLAAFSREEERCVDKLAQALVKAFSPSQT